ncbi:patatin-like phospholipase family protein [Noviherbaspirillum sp. CPCC 100848]|uniref:Patatin-like phospholipase family protein n=1 Tax=Noviherbaspirillum album TaxID=3080276 RepID=A0ABU6JHX1_9BURK|nr:patatin-like phospholipase family protein [Noviherbaspirillum sp. CPCC 100848]MEC4723278.1 patatin-like phospholipase family protein [Noviherbaspirillum sp. CPCC 100848]
MAFIARHGRIFGGFGIVVVLAAKSKAVAHASQLGKRELKFFSSIVDGGEVHSVFFKNCFGVFQGGGARAVALAGAYGATYASGIRLSEVAGTSAGAIAAVLIAAGATPEVLEEALKELDFQKLLVPPEPTGRFDSMSWRAAGWAISPGGVVNGTLGTVSKMLRYGGCYSSKGVQDWVESQLQKLLPGGSKPVKFKDLYLPTYVVATNLAERSAHVWSSSATPDESVSLAVRASCSIPGFFQPVLIGGKRFVDGGILSNLPAFVFDNTSQRSSKRILAYRLTAAPEAEMQWTPKGMAAQIIETLVGGATELQVDIQKSVSCIDIPTLGIKATDFHKMDETNLGLLIKSGKDAAQEFLGSEVERLRSTQSFPQILRFEEEVYFAVARQSEVLPKEIVIAESNTRWFWQLFPSVLFWRIKGVPIRVFVQPPIGNDDEITKEKARRLNLAGLGVEVMTVETLPLQGYVFIRDDEHASSAILMNHTMRHGPNATLYERNDPQVINLVREKLFTYNCNPIQQGKIPKLAAADWDELCETLRKRVSQYKNAEVKRTRLPLENCRLTNKLLRTYKYEQLIRLVQIYEETSLSLYAPVNIVLADGSNSLICPPVFEQYNDVTASIRGNTRTYLAYTQGRHEIECVLVRGVTMQLPSKTVPLKESRLIDWQEDPATRMPGFDHGLFRRIESACRPHR